LDDLDTLKEVAIRKFDDRLAHSPANEPLEREVAQLQAELEQIYRVVVPLQNNEPSMERTEEIWQKMVGICDEFARRLSAIAGKSAAYRASHDRILDLRNAAEDRRRLHAKA
jgi:predicted acetyltransferase